jgi:hypothetical protein
MKITKVEVEVAGEMIYVSRMGDRCVHIRTKDRDGFGSRYECDKGETNPQAAKRIARAFLRDCFDQRLGDAEEWAFYMTVKLFFVKR